jgi:hypothetical protein
MQRLIKLIIPPNLSTDGAKVPMKLGISISRWLKSKGLVHDKDYSWYTKLGAYDSDSKTLGPSEIHIFFNDNNKVTIDEVQEQLSKNIVWSELKGKLEIEEWE